MYVVSGLKPQKPNLDEFTTVLASVPMFTILLASVYTQHEPK